MIVDLKQAVGLVLLAGLVGFGGNTLRGRPLPLSGPLDPPAPAETGADLLSASAADALEAWLGGAFFLDLRSPGEWETHRVAGSLSLDATRFTDRYFEVAPILDLEQPIFLYGGQADSFAVRHTVAELEAMGHVDVRFVVCGLEGLLDEGLDPAEGPGEEFP